jgi:hypothetical protein
MVGGFCCYCFIAIVDVDSFSNLLLRGLRCIGLEFWNHWLLGVGKIGTFVGITFGTTLGIQGYGRWGERTS